ncbi:MAG: DUF4166 domain-containing protein [Gammaproteobacteria bacterium]|nr:DUF4166 domain-containing protein [Gammaproteobacteria bacterium]
MTITNHQYAPIRQALGKQWSALGSVIRRHYDLPPNTDTHLVVNGAMEVFHSPFGKILITAARLFDALVPYKGRNIPVTVQNWSQPDSTAMFWRRTFRFPEKTPIVFYSRMEYVGDHDIVEYVKYGLGIRMTLSAEGGTLRYDSCGYHWDLGPLKMHLPEWLLLGSATIREIPVSEKTFKVEFETNHPLWGRTFGYSGQFAFCN